MKTLSKLNLLFAISVILWGCADDDNLQEVLPVNSENTEESMYLENGNEVIIYPNGVAVEKLPDGRIVWGGDIALNEKQLQALTEPDTRAGILRDNSMFWPDGIVYYTLADDVMRSGAYIDIYDAMKHIEERCNISFHKKQSNTKNWIEFVLSEDDVSRSHLGMTGGKQNIWVTSDVNTSTAIHEICHALGMIHEHQRMDRDNYIVVDFSNIRPEWHQWFYRTSIPHNTYGSSLEPLDTKSIMIYGSYGENTAINPDFPYMWRKTDGTTWTNNNVLSEMDILTLNAVYSKPHYTITCKPQCTLSGTVSGSDHYAKGEICVLQAFPEDNRGFLGWFDGDKKISSSNIYLVQVTSDKTYEARFTYPINVHCEISVTKNSLGKPLGTTNAGSFGTATGNAVTIEATPNFGNQFVHWLDLDTGEILSTKTAYLFPAKRDMRIMAVFKRDCKLKCVK